MNTAKFNASFNRIWMESVFIPPACIPEYERAEQTEGYTDYDVGPLKEELERLDYAALGLKVVLLRAPA